MENKSSKHEGDAFQLDDTKGKWYGQNVGVNSEVPLADSGQGKPYIIRQFEFSFNPDFLLKLQQRKVAKPSNQDLFNAHWRQIQHTLWMDGLVARQDVDPRLITGRKKYKIILLCEARSSTFINQKAQTLQEITPSGKLGRDGKMIKNG